MGRGVLLALLAPACLSAQASSKTQPETPRATARRALAALERVAEARARIKATEEYDPLFQKYSKRYFGANVDWKLFKAQGMAESELNPTAKSWVGARGIMQLMPSTFDAISAKRPEFKSITDPEWNIAAGIMHDRYLWRLYEKEIGEGERRHFMFAGYNAGEGTINRARGAALAARLDYARWSDIERVAPSVRRWRYRETLGYVKKIQQNYTGLSNSR